jgi:hypothetical protein
MSEAPKKTVAELVAAVRAKAAAKAVEKGNNASRAASPARSTSTRSTSVSRRRTIENQIAHAEARAKLLREKEASMSNLSSKVSKPSFHNEVAELEKKLEEAEAAHNTKVRAKRNFNERRAASRNRSARFANSAEATQYTRKNGVRVRTSNGSMAKQKVEEINRESKRLEREAKVAETAVRHASDALKAKQQKMERLSLAASAASSRSGSPTGSVRSTSTARARRLTANEQNARAANLRIKAAAQQTRKLVAAQKKAIAINKKLANVYKKLEGVNDNMLDAFCEELKERRAANNA